MSSFTDKLFVRNKHVCPWYCCFTFDNIFRRRLQNPYTILKGLVKPGDAVLDIGPGQGYFSVPMAEMAGQQGKIIAVDIQPQMLNVLHERGVKAGFADRIHCKLVKDTNYGLNSEIDFALAFWMVHEVPDKKELLNTIYISLKPGAKLLIAEPLFHVSGKMMEETFKISIETGFILVNRPKIFFSRTLLLEKV